MAGLTGPLVLVTAVALCHAPAMGETPVLNDFTVSKAFACGERHFLMLADGLDPGIKWGNGSIRLTQAGQPDIVATDIYGIENHNGPQGWVTGAFDLSPGVAGGLWSVVVTNPGGESATLVDVLEVVPDCPRGAVGDLYVCNGGSDGTNQNTILQFEGSTGVFVCIFAERPADLDWGPGIESNFRPFDLAWAPNGHLWVTSSTNIAGRCVVEYDGATGEFIRYIVPLTAPNQSLQVLITSTLGGPEGRIHFTSHNGDDGPGLPDAKVYRLEDDPPCMPVAVLEPEIAPVPVMHNPDTGKFASNGNFLLLGKNDPATPSAEPTFRKLDGETLAFVRDLAIDFGNKTGVIESPDGLSYLVAEFTLARIDRYDIATGQFVETFVSAPSSPNYYERMKDPGDMAFGSNGHLYVSTEHTNSQGAPPNGSVGSWGAVHEFDADSGQQIGLIGHLEFNVVPQLPETLREPHGIEFKPMPGDYASAGSAFGGDWTVDLKDFAKLLGTSPFTGQAVFAGPGVPVKDAHAVLSFDQDRDGDLDLADFAAFQRLFGSSLQATGACCEADGSCTNEVWPPECNSGAVYLGDGTSCESSMCAATGACCLPDGNCAELTLAGCDDQEGHFQGEGKTCSGVSCPFGACCFASGGCAELRPGDCPGVYQGTGSTCAGTFCSEPCPAMACDGFAEGEEPACPIPGFLMDVFNGGCNSSTPVFSPIACGDTVCGQFWAQNQGRDTDWFELVITQPTQVGMTATGEFSLVAGLVATDPPGTGDCADSTGVISPGAIGDPCEAVGGAFPTVFEPGVYWLFVAPAAWEGAPCDEGPWEYTASVTCVPPGAGGPGAESDSVTWGASASMKAVLSTEMGGNETHQITKDAPSGIAGGE